MDCCGLMNTLLSDGSVNCPCVKRRNYPQKLVMNVELLVNNPMLNGSIRMDILILDAM